MTTKTATTAAKKPAKTKPADDLAAAEAELVRRYPKQRIVKNSIKPAGTYEKFGNKRTVEIHCHETNTVFRIATSDLHQTHYCKTAIAKIRKDKTTTAATKTKKPTKTKEPKTRKPRADKGKPRRTPKDTAPATTETTQPDTTTETPAPAPAATETDIVIPTVD